MAIPFEAVERGEVDFSDVVDPHAPELGPVHPGEILLKAAFELEAVASETAAV